MLDKADTEFTEILYTAVKEQTPLEKVQRYICNRAAGVCKKKPPPLTKTRKHDEKFQAMSVRAHAWRAIRRAIRRNSARNSAQLGAIRHAFSRRSVAPIHRRTRSKCRTCRRT